MEFRYQIPKHLQGYLEDVTEAELSRVMTMMFELAIHYGLLDSPKRTLEKRMTEVKNMLTQLMENQRKDTVEILASLINLSSKIDNLNLVAAPRAYATSSNPLSDDSEYNPDLIEDIEVIDETEEAATIEEELSEEERERRLEQGFLNNMLR